MITYTHIVTETGNGLPAEGDEVLIPDYGGWHSIATIDESSPIHTGPPGEGNYIWVTLAPADRDYDDLSDDDADDALEDLPRAIPLEEIDHASD